jgi:hypothetical protein
MPAKPAPRGRNRGTAKSAEVVDAADDDGSEYEESRHEKSRPSKKRKIDAAKPKSKGVIPVNLSKLPPTKK